MNETIRIGSKSIGKDKPVFIIAEGGVNHNGRLDLALKLVDAAADAGADAIKFQTWTTPELVTMQAQMAEYQKKNLGKTTSQAEMLRKVELKEEYFPAILRRAAKRKLILLSSAHGGFAAVDRVQRLGLPAFKIASGDTVNYPILAHAAKYGKPIILGTGMCTMAELKESIRIMRKAGNDKIVMLHCTTNYPTPSNEVNLRAMLTMMRELDVLIGYSDHTIGHQVATMAVTLGACCIEKHLTLDKNMEGPDHKASSEPQEFKAMADSIRNIEVIMGSPIKKPCPSETRIMAIARKSIVTTATIKKGDRFTKNNIGIKRPGNGIPPQHYWKILGETAKKNISSDKILRPSDIE
ncbi:MAG: N-acetylneuraminate synthase [Candidatus Yanofskybacteria bacterium]|nr:N-acetylneuraminate synthase [Candidatus Yanofskybacteria bacterium]